MDWVGIDVGGTFTDIVVLGSSGQPTIRKVLSTPDDYSQGIEGGLQGLLASEIFDPKQVASVVHAATVATNSIITGTGARVGLLTTSGFRDVLEIGRLRMPRLYDMDWVKPSPLVPRRLRREVIERIDHRGGVLRALDVRSVEAELEVLLRQGVESIAVCFLHSYANPIHEQQVADLIQLRAPEIDVSLSHKVLAEIKEYERTSTTVINAYVKPRVHSYLGNLELRLSKMGVDAPLMVMHSAGGMMKAATAAEYPVQIIESGPAAGVVGAAEVGRRLQIGNIISLDMGGTTAKACLIEDGAPRIASEFEVGAGVSVGHRLLKGGGYILRVPSVDLVEIGAGGGSIAWIDNGGVLRVGTQSAGADPGPACYSKGGTEPTVTDANVALGYLNTHSLAGGDLLIDADAAARAIHDRIALPLGLPLEVAAFGIHSVVNSNMVRAVQAVSSEIGRDPREFTLFAFGGSGPVHAASLAIQARIPSVIIPPGPGVFSAIGLLMSQVEHRYSRTFWRDMDDLDVETMLALFHELEIEALDTMRSEGVVEQEVEIQLSIDMRYRGQGAEVNIPLGTTGFAEEVIPNLIDAFHQEHERSYGYRSEGEQVQCVNLRLRARVTSPAPIASAAITPAAAVPRDEREEPAARRAYFGTEFGWLETPIIPRGALAVSKRWGPLIIEEYDSTTVVPPNARVELDEANNLRVDLRNWLS